jgi:folate-binding protein YgfZ
MPIEDEFQTLLGAAGHGLVRPLPAAWLAVVGPDAADFLHRVCSQDVLGMAPGTCRPAAFLSGKGRLVATALVGRVADGCVLETDAHLIDELMALLDRYHFAERLELVRPAGSVAAALVGRAAPELAGLPAGHAAPTPDGGIVLTLARHGLSFVHRHGPADAVDAWAGGLGVPLLDAAAAECLRILIGQVRVGTDTDQATLALEAALDEHIATDKGCYTGQEVVARIHTYGHVNRRLALLRIATEEPVAAGSKLRDPADGEVVGRVTSTARVPGRALTLALGYLPENAIGPDAKLALETADGPRVHCARFGPA